VAKEKIMRELYSEMKYSSESVPTAGPIAPKQILVSLPAYNNNEHNDELIIDCDEPTAVLNDCRYYNVKFFFSKLNNLWNSI